MAAGRGGRRDDGRRVIADAGMTGHAAHGALTALVPRRQSNARRSSGVRDGRTPYTCARVKASVFSTCVRATRCFARPPRMSQIKNSRPGPFFSKHANDATSEPSRWTGGNCRVRAIWDLSLRGASRHNTGGRRATKSCPRCTRGGPETAALRLALRRRSLLFFRLQANAPAGHAATREHLGTIKKRASENNSIEFAISRAARNQSRWRLRSGGAGAVLGTKSLSRMRMSQSEPGGAGRASSLRQTIVGRPVSAPKATRAQRWVLPRFGTR